jgi:hypothetical protein
MKLQFGDGLIIAHVGDLFGEKREGVAIPSPQEVTIASRFSGDSSAFNVIVMAKATRLTV